MSTFSKFEEAVRDKRITYKEMVMKMYDCEDIRDAVAKLFDQLAVSEDDPKVLRKKHRDAQVEKFGDDKEAIKTAMSEYDKSIRANTPAGETKPKPKPPIRVWTDEVKVYTKAKNAYVKSKEKEHGDDVTVADLKALRKKWRKEYDGEHKAPKAEPEPEPEPVAEPVPELEAEPVAEVVAEDVAEEDGEDEVEVVAEVKLGENTDAYYEEDNSSDEERENQEDERERELEANRQEDERQRKLAEAKLQEEEAKPKPTKEQKARYKVLNKNKANLTDEEKAEYKALKKVLA